MAKEQVFLANGEPLEGVALERDEFDAYSEYMHGAVHVWVWRKFEGNTQFLIQKRSLTKKTLPGMLDISAAGHIDEAETSIDAAAREANEGIGLQIVRDKLLFVVRIRKTNVSNGISTVYAYQVDESFNPKFNDGEVDSYQWVDLDALEGLVASPETHNFADHGKGYFTIVFERLKMV